MKIHMVDWFVFHPTCWYIWPALTIAIYPTRELDITLAWLNRELMLSIAFERTPKKPQKPIVLVDVKPTAFQFTHPIQATHAKDCPKKADTRGCATSHKRPRKGKKST